MKLVGEKVILRWPKIQDAQWLFENFTRPEIANGLSNPACKELTLEKEKKWIRSQAGRRRKKEAIEFIVLEKLSGSLVGACGLVKINTFSNWAELGFWIAPEYQSKGYVTEASKLVMNYGFKELNLNRIEAFCFTRNTASIKVQEKLGMKREAKLRQRANCNGKYCDVYISSMLKSEWKG